MGEISLECSRPGAAAVGLWTTQRLLPLKKDGRFAAGLSKGRKAALALYKKLERDARFFVPFEPELDIVVWTLRASRASESSALARSVFHEAGRRGLHLALAELPVHFFHGKGDPQWEDGRTVTCLRSVLMKPEHLEWIDEIYRILDLAVKTCDVEYKA